MQVGPSTYSKICVVGNTREDAQGTDHRVDEVSSRVSERN